MHWWQYHRPIWLRPRLGWTLVGIGRAWARDYPEDGDAATDRAADQIVAAMIANVPGFPPDRAAHLALRVRWHLTRRAIEHHDR